MVPRAHARRQLLDLRLLRPVLRPGTCLLYTSHDTGNVGTGNIGNAKVGLGHIGHADITGAYIAGIVLCTMNDASYVERRVDISNYIIFAPIFFVLLCCSPYRRFSPR